MNISKDKYKCLDVLMDGKPVHVADNPKLVKWFKESSTDSGEGGTHYDLISALFSRMRAQLRKNVIMVSQPMQTLVAKNFQRMVDALCEDWLKDQMGALLHPDGTMYVYYTERVPEEFTSSNERINEEKCKGIGILLHFNNKGVLTNSVFCSSRVLRSDELSKVEPIDDNIKERRLIMYDAIDDNPVYIQRVIEEFSPLLCTLAFLQYADTEKVYLENGQKKVVKTSGETINNTTGMPVTFYDSRWVREIIRTEGFSVRGHFRLACVGKGRAERKLIYINPYEKHGYHRRAAKDLVGQGGA